MGKDPDEIRREIARTREEMDDTVEAIGYKADVPARVKENIDERVEHAKSVVGGTFESVKETLGETMESVKHSFGSTKDRVANAGLANGATGLAGSAGAQAKRAYHVVRENPVGLAIGGLAVGFLAGLAAPVTAIEREKIGPLRDDLVQKGQAVAQDAIDHGTAVVKETIASVAETAQHSAQTHSQSVVETAKTTFGVNDRTPSAESPSPTADATFAV